MSRIYLNKAELIKNMLSTPVALFIFNRPDLTKLVFDKIAKAKPKHLLVIADGPRQGNEQDIVLCKEARDIVENITWDCRVSKNYSDVNLGMALREATGFSWVFEQVDRAILLEDDCIPELSFFRFCEELLEKFKDDHRVLQINGHNFQFENIRTDYSYYFSRYQINWGWATWRRAWKLYDYNIKLWPELKKSRFPYGIIRNDTVSEYFRRNFDRVYSDDSTDDVSTWKPKWTWDYQWDFTFFIQNGVSICPRESLMINAGFRKDATNTRNANNPYAKIKSKEMEFPLRHPPYMLVDTEADDFMTKGIENKINMNKNNKSNYIRIRNKLKKGIKKFF